ncbi:MAG: DUF6268 family outer membrane beta-barrel protein [Bacteroidales bacterium]|nr:DUF6268 family outer membrane beta-barrel protein [Bacteroidales bacterium]
MIKKLLILSLIVLFLSELYPQKTFTIAEVNYMLSPSNSYVQKDTTSDAHFISGFVNVPIVISEKSTLLTGIRGNVWKVSYSPEQVWHETYYSLGLTLGYNHKFNEKKSFLFILLPRLNSDYKNINSNALQLGFFTTYSKRSSEKFLWKVGMYFNMEFFGPFVVPLFGLNWDVAPKLNITGDLPIYAKIRYKIHDNFSTGVGYIALVSSYRLRGEFNDAYTSRYAIEPYAFAEVKFLKQVYFTGKFGYTMGRKYPVYAKDDRLDWQLSFIKFGENRTQLNPEIQDNFFFELGLAFKVEVSDKD